ncbi:MAG TPA: hypothetical protein VMB03_15955 [Bryobacteraceae bacterium]|nr:hypothetical protein [Bryobacteraceae bacterium]
MAAVTPTSSRQTKSWFAITVVEEGNSAQNVAGLTIAVELTDAGIKTGTTSKKSPVVRFDDLTPGGAGNIVETSDEKVAWEVIADIE